ncbi:hypothetical protein [Algoriphagus sp. NG3]|uniref:hypothetical protein n=1 Tax=Algoriphagus sp. NG3 TaxID=3097546 RepID=UPI002A7F8F09|nr:hypothetical protein [Algoriphagus sp. NG3]WPR76218.1 hypothetical protein SLW71_02520 [Algoriphagus sp. NG3]
MKKSLNIYIGAILTGTIFLSACADLDVENLNNPNTDKVLATPDDLKGVVAGAFSNLYGLFRAYRGQVNLEHTADHTTMTNNVSNWWSEFKVEPRPQFANSLANSNRAGIIDNPFKLTNSAISSAVDVIRLIENEGVEIGTNGTDTQMVLAAAYFAKGMAEGYLASTYDQGYVVDKDTDLTTIELQPYDDVMDIALADLDKVIELATSSSFQLDPTFINTPSPMGDADLARLASTYSAHFMMTRSRTKAQNDANDWAKIKELAKGGITDDYIIVQDGSNWDNAFVEISGLDWYFRIDHRIIRIFDPSYPKRYPLEATALLPPATSDDKRLELYYFYEEDMSRFNLTRGAQLRSNYRIGRWDEFYRGGGIGPIPYFFDYINQLIIAEAEVMTGNTQAAIDILNEGNRITVGGLEPLPNTLTDQEVLQTIWDERDIEVCRTDWAIPFMDARRRGILQRGVLLHFPVPITEMLVLGLPEYTFGGQSAADGINTSDGEGAWYTPPGL